MTKKEKHAISPTRDEDYAQWYQQVVKAAELAEHSAVRGCMVIYPWGYGIWENIQRILNDKIKETGHKNAYFPLFIPLSYFEKEAEHIEGFAKECAVVTHHKLEKNKDGSLKPSGELEEPLIVRPTSEMIIGDTFSKWVESYRDLPILINQWANIVRWEMRTRLFLRSTEFLWQEGHTVHETKEEAIKETLDMLNLYKGFFEKELAMPVWIGEKTESEKFPGAVSTYALEVMMQDGKALQGGTSHFLGQNFSKASNISFADRNGDLQFAWTTSWGVTTRLIGAIIMVHSDDDGLVLPPHVATDQIVILPVLHQDDKRKMVLEYCHELKKEIEKIYFGDNKIRVVIDKRDLRGGEKKWSWIKKGVPVRLEIGPRDIENGKLTISRRDKNHQEKNFQSKDEFLQNIKDLLQDIQNNLFAKAKAYQEKITKEISSKEEFYQFFQGDGGFAICYWSEDEKIEEHLKNELSVSVRCVPICFNGDRGKCIFTNKANSRKVVFARAY